MSIKNRVKRLENILANLKEDEEDKVIIVDDISIPHKYMILSNKGCQVMTEEEYFKVKERKHSNEKLS